MERALCAGVGGLLALAAILPWTPMGSLAVVPATLAIGGAIWLLYRIVGRAPRLRPGQRIVEMDEESEPRHVIKIRHVPRGGRPRQLVT